MFAEEWPLMMFTLATQLAVGTFLMLVLVRSSVGSRDAAAAAKVTEPGFKAVGALTMLAMVLSLFHLGTPLGAYRSIYNLQSAWLSREILTVGGFLVLWFFSYRAYRHENTGNALAWIASLVGLAVIFSMSSIYVHSIRPAWANPNTYFAFFGATLALGGMGAAALIAYGAKGDNIVPVVISQLKKVSLIASAAVILPMLYLPVFVNGLSGGDAAAQMSVRLLTGDYQTLLIVRWILSLAGVGLAVAGLRRAAELRTSRIYLALLLVLAGEFLGRYVFYGSAVSTMIGLQ